MTNCILINQEEQYLHAIMKSITWFTTNALVALAWSVWIFEAMHSMQWQPQSALRQPTNSILVKSKPTHGQIIKQKENNNSNPWRTKVMSQIGKSKWMNLEWRIVVNHHIRWQDPFAEDRHVSCIEDNLQRLVLYCVIARNYNHTIIFLRRICQQWQMSV